MASVPVNSKHCRTVFLFQAVSLAISFFYCQGEWFGGTKIVSSQFIVRLPFHAARFDFRLLRIPTRALTLTPHLLLQTVVVE